MTKIEELEAQRAEKIAARAAAEEAQYEKDLEARIRLEDDYGALAGVKVVGFKPGQPTCAFVKTPSPAQYKRYKDLIQRAGDDKKSAGKKSDAIDQLARDAWVYPEADDARESMLEAFPGILTPIFIAAVRLAEGKSEDEGK